MALWKLIRLFSRERPDIVHSTTPKPGLLTALAAFITRVPVRLHTFTGQPWVNMTGVMRWVARTADKLICRLNTGCYADSPSQRDFLLQEGIARPGKLGVLGHGSLAGVDTRRFDPGRWPAEERASLRARLGIAADERVVTFIGRLSPDKGIRELLSAFVRLLRQGHRYHLLLVGPRDDECGGSAGDLDISSAHPGSIHFVGYDPQPEKYLAISDLHCLPSYREGFGTSVLEAASMGVPSLGSRIYGLTDAIAEGVSGVLVAPRDAEALYRALAELLADPARLESMGRAARQRVLEKFGQRQLSELLIAEYRRLARAT